LFRDFVFLSVSWSISYFEKDRDFAATIERMLNVEGYEVETAKSLNDVQQKTPHHEYDVLIVSKSPACEDEMEGLQRIDSNSRKGGCTTWISPT
jgi:DNA-binding response OmpR family regulator